MRRYIKLEDKWDRDFIINIINPSYRGNADKITVSNVVESDDAIHTIDYRGAFITKFKDIGGRKLVIELTYDFQEENLASKKEKK
jgi:hypothetical protein